MVPMIHHGSVEVFVIHVLDPVVEESGESMLGPAVTSSSPLHSHWDISQTEDLTGRTYDHHI